jgi:hypothetical protein
VSASTKRQVIKWVHDNGGGNYIDDVAAFELKWAEGLRPDHPIKLYRGLLFGKNSLSDGIIARRDARIFTNALLHGHTQIHMQYPHAQSWTDSEQIADRFAKSNPAGSQYGAMMNWLHNAGKFIDRDLGLVISATVYPHDIMCDVSKMDLGHLTHGDEGEFIVVKNAKLDVTIEHIYTKKGPITAEQFAEFHDQLLNPPTAA